MTGICWICRRHDQQASFDARDTTGRVENPIENLKLRDGAEVPVCKMCRDIIKRLTK